MKDFESCISEKIITEDEADIDRARSLVKFAGLRQIDLLKKLVEEKLK